MRVAHLIARSCLARARAALGLHAYLLLDARSVSDASKHRPNLRRVAQIVANKHRKLEYLVGEKGGGDLATTLINWRNELRRNEKLLLSDADDKLKNSLAIYAFVQGKQKLEFMTEELELRKFADAQLDVAVQSARKVKAAKPK